MFSAGESVRSYVLGQGVKAKPGSFLTVMDAMVCGVNSTVST